MHNPYAMAIVAAVHGGSAETVDVTACRGPRPVLVERLVFREPEIR